jgi:two-component system chemotaxis response regulator CheY
LALEIAFFFVAGNSSEFPATFILWIAALASPPRIARLKEGLFSPRPIVGVGAQVKKRKILIADDSLLLRETLRAMLKRSGWAVVGEAVNGREAIEKARDLKPDLVVIDLSMPVMNGIDAIRELRRFRPSLPLVMFTSYVTDAFSALALATGAIAVIDKAEPTVLIAFIHSLFTSAA